MKKIPPRARTYGIINRVYNYALFVRIGGSRDDALQWFAKRFNLLPCDQIGSSRRAAATTIVHTSEKSHAIWFDNKPDAGIIAHEALHSVQHVMQFSGVGALSDATEEAYAYLLEWTVDFITSRVLRAYGR